ncbi:MAG TPA: hypothetical protein VGG64_07970 [Pirellulales bacterium]|jgi:hypothetical protein
MPPPNRTNVTVSVDDAHLSQIHQVAARLRAAGMEVEQTLDHIGAISGHVGNDGLAGLARVPGVAAVEPERSFQLPPPDAKIQ